MPDEPAPTPARTFAVPTPLKRYDYYLGPKLLGDAWSVSRGALKLKCTLSTHRLGWELRLASTSSFSRSQVCKSETEVLSTSDAWLAEARSKGWTPG